MAVEEETNMPARYGNEPSAVEAPRSVYREASEASLHPAA